MKCQNKDVAELINAGAYSAALALCDQLSQTHAEITIDKAYCLCKLGQLSEACRIMEAWGYKNITTLNIVHHCCHFFNEVEQYETLIDICQTSLAYFSDDSIIWRHLGLAHFYLGEYRFAEKAYRKVYQLEQNARAAYNLGLVLLHLGNYQEGFKLYEHRISVHKHITGIDDACFPFPRWSGQSLQNSTILIWVEQGFGDIILFSRFISLLARQAKKVDVLLRESDMVLYGVLQSLEGIGQIYFIKDNKLSLPSAYDFHCPLLSIMHCLSLMPNSIPANIPYITVQSDTEKYKEAVVSANLAVGLVWGSKTIGSNSDKHNQLKNTKSLSLEQLTPFFSLNNIAFTSLNLPVTEQEKLTMKQYNIQDFSDSINNFSDTADIINHLDVIVTIDSSVAHLAGAMGKPTIVLLPAVCDWRWQVNRDDSPWYPTMRLYRQVWLDDWKGVIHRVTSTLKNLSEEYKLTQCIDIKGK